MLKITVVIVLFCTLFAGCSKKNEDVALVVDGEKITGKQIDQAIEMFRQSVIKTMPEKALESISPSIRATVAKQLVTNHLMVKEAKKRNLQVDSSKVNKAYDKLRSGYADEESFRQELKEMGENEASVKEELQRGALLDTLLKIILVNTDTATEQECREFYNKNSSRYLSSPRFRVSQVLFLADSSKDRAGWEKSQKDARLVHEKLVKGQRFEDVTSKYSKNPNVQAGDMGWFKKGDLKQELQSAIETKKVGEVSDVVCTDIGFHILMKSGEEDEKILPFEEVQDMISKMIIIHKKTDVLESFADSLIKSAKIKYLDSSLIPVESGLAR